MRSPNELFHLIPTSDAVLRAALATGLDSARSARTDQLAAFLADACGDTTVALVHYGSHAQQSQPKPESAHDFFIIVDRYRDAYRSLASRGVARFRPRVATLLNHLLAPTSSVSRCPASRRRSKPNAPCIRGPIFASLHRPTREIISRWADCSNTCKLRGRATKKALNA